MDKNNMGPRNIVRDTYFDAEGAIVADVSAGRGAGKTRATLGTKE